MMTSQTFFKVTTTFVVTFLLQLSGLVGISEAEGNDEPETVTLTLHPQAAPTPPLKYRLLPSLEKQFPGNAAVFYAKVFAERQSTSHDNEFWFEHPELLSAPLGELQNNEVVLKVVAHQGIFALLERASYADTCDWQISQVNAPYYSILLPEVQRTFAFTKVLALKTRYSLSLGDYDASLTALQSGFGLSRNIAAGQTLTHPVVGSLTAKEHVSQLYTWVQQPSSPNLYWALTALPDPFIDYRTGFGMNQIILERSFSAFENIHSDNFNSNYWNEQLLEIWEAANRELAGVSSRKLMPLEMLTMKVYPVAKRSMLDEGYDLEQVESMPVSRVILMYEYRQFQRQLEERYPLTFLSYPEAIRRLNELQPAASDPLSLLSPFDFSMSVEQVLHRKVQLETKIALLRVIEAIRMYSAENNAKLPESLGEIKLVPIPDDPMTGRPFSYKIENQTATISLDRSAEKPNRFKITIVEEQK